MKTNHLKSVVLFPSILLFFSTENWGVYSWIYGGDLLVEKVIEILTHRESSPPHFSTFFSLILVFSLSVPLCYCIYTNKSPNHVINFLKPNHVITFEPKIWISQGRLNVKIRLNTVVVPFDWKCALVKHKLTFT